MKQKRSGSNGVKVYCQNLKKKKLVKNVAQPLAFTTLTVQDRKRWKGKQLKMEAASALARTNTTKKRR